MSPPSKSLPALTPSKAPLLEGLPSSGQEGGSLLAGGKVKSLGCDIPEIIQRTPGGCSRTLSPLWPGSLPAVEEGRAVGHEAGEGWG